MLKTGLWLVSFFLFAGLLVADDSVADNSAADNSAENSRVVIADYSDDFFKNWQQKSFQGETHYSLVDSSQGKVLKALADASASALYRRIDLDLDKTPYLNWSWKVENVFPINDQKIKSGDDFPARVYVVFKTGFFPWQTRALNYVWSNTPEQSAFWPNPFTANAVMIPLRFGEQGLGSWQHQKVNVQADYLRVFGEAVSNVHGVAIMTDADNTGGRAVAYYGPVYFSQ